MSEKRGETFVIAGEGSSGGTKHRPIEFTPFLLGLASSALIHLGEAPNPETGRVEKNLEGARELVDLLTMLREKTRGNLTKEEEEIFNDLLADLRLRFVEASRT